MKKSSLPVSFKTLMKYKNEGSLKFDCEIQRAGSQWNNLQASLFIHSILGDYIVPNVYLTKEDGVLNVLDGKQRLTTVLAFVNDEFSLHPKTPDVVVDDVSYNIAYKKFSELDEDLKSAILQYRFGTYQLEDCTDEDIEETFARLNAGTPLSKIQTARPKLGVELSGFFNKIAASNFFQEACNFTLSQLRKEDDLLMSLTIAMLIDSLYYKDFEIKTSASSAEVVRFCEDIKNNYLQERQDNLELLIEFLEEAFPLDDYKFLRKTNIPVIAYLGFKAMEMDLEPVQFGNVVIAFYDSTNEEYAEACGAGNVKMTKVLKRIELLQDFLEEKFETSFNDEESEEDGNGTEDTELSDESE